MQDETPNLTSARLPAKSFRWGGAVLAAGASFFLMLSPLSVVVDVIVLSVYFSIDMNFPHYLGKILLTISFARSSCPFQSTATPEIHRLATLLTRFRSWLSAMQDTNHAPCLPPLLQVCCSGRYAPSRACHRCRTLLGNLHPVAHNANKKCEVHGYGWIAVAAPLGTEGHGVSILFQATDLL